MDQIEIKQNVKKRYAEIALREQSCCAEVNECCQETSEARLVDYGSISRGLPEGADLGLGCGLPVQYAEIKPGEVVLDLGSGAGIDVFWASKAAGSTGKVIGVDMTPEMINRASQNAQRGGYSNVEFRLGELENLPVEDASVDVVLSNCVINLVPDKEGVFQEIFRVLKPGGTFTISDMVTTGSVPESVRSDPELWACCIGGAEDRTTYLELIQKVGFDKVEILAESTYDEYQKQEYSVQSITLLGTKK